MSFLLSWMGSYLKAAFAAAVVLGAASLLMGFLGGAEVTPRLVATVVLWLFVGVATAAIVPAILVSAGPELVGIGPNGLLYSAVGAAFALAALGGISIADVQEAKLLDASENEVKAWLAASFDGVPKPQMAVFAFAGASAGGALARSRRRALRKAAS